MISKNTNQVENVYLRIFLLQPKTMTFKMLHLKKNYLSNKCMRHSHSFSIYVWFYLRDLQSLLLSLVSRLQALVNVLLSISCKMQFLTSVLVGDAWVSEFNYDLKINRLIFTVELERQQWLLLTQIENFLECTFQR